MDTHMLLSRINAALNNYGLGESARLASVRRILDEYEINAPEAFLAVDESGRSACDDMMANAMPHTWIEVGIMHLVRDRPWHTADEVCRIVSGERVLQSHDDVNLAVYATVPATQMGSKEIRKDFDGLVRRGLLRASGPAGIEVYQLTQSGDHALDACLNPATGLA